METIKNEKTEIRTSGNVVKMCVNFLKLASIPAAIIAGAFVLKKGIGKPILMLNDNVDFLGYVLAERKFSHCSFEDF